MSRLWSVAVWSVIAAAFIGPGTVTTAAAAGASHGTGILWALTFSTVACLLLQEAAGRLTVVSGLTLGEALRRQYAQGVGRVAVLTLVLGAVIVGCAAYQAGNILGGVTGAMLGTGLSRQVLTLGCGGAAALLLFSGAPRTVARLLSVLVATMGIAFVWTATEVGVSATDVLSGAVVPRLPSGSGLLVLGLVGTTVVPYNLFLGSGLARGQTLAELRFGLSVSVILGGVISMAIVVVGSLVEGPFTFDALADVLTRRLGPWSRSLFSLGLFAAGFTSAVTAPLAAAITGRDLLGDRDSEAWRDRGSRFRGIWLLVLAVGLAFGLADVRPIPAIVLAQALNGLLLPLVAVFLLVAVNDRRLMGPDRLNGALGNALLGTVVLVTLALGLSLLARAATTSLGWAPLEGPALAGTSGAIALVLAWPLARVLRARRRLKN